MRIEDIFGAREMAKWIKCLPCKQKNLVQILSTHTKTRGVGGDRKILGSC